MNDKRTFTGMVVVAAMLTAPAMLAAQPWHVDDNNTAGPHNGQTWATAFQYLQDALDVAQPGHTIKVAQGVYHPDDATVGHAEGRNETLSTGITSPMSATSTPPTPTATARLVMI